MTDTKLLALADKAMKNAYAPYSGFCVGAALLCADGAVYQGCNIENAAFSPTICAERTAFAKAVSEGYRKFTRIAIAATTEQFCPPCGVCRQVMMEFAPNLEVICLNGKGEAKHFTLKELLPYGFDSSWL